MPDYSDIFYEVKDGLKLYARDYPCRETSSAPPVLCMHGLTRNSADFEDLCPRLSHLYRVIAVDQRGRGRSQWDQDSCRYQLHTYVQDMWQLLDQLDIDKVAIIGTSMGGLIGMLMAAQKPERIAGLVINDVGPEVDSAGLARILSYVGKTQPPRSWEQAIALTRELNQVCFPGYSDAQWRTMARRLYRQDADGIPVAAYDPAIATAFEAPQEAPLPPDLWPLFASLSGTPVLAVRGALSDLLSVVCLERMQRELPSMRAVEVPGVGHAPMLDEPEALCAINDFLLLIQEETQIHE
jgi:pimeloyl-ACP methyl ester carboxylesterase